MLLVFDRLSDKSVFFKLPLIFYLFCHQYVFHAIRRVQVNQDGLKLNGTHQLLAYADDNNNNIYLTAVGLSPGGSGFEHIQVLDTVLLKFTFTSGGGYMRSM